MPNDYYKITAEARKNPRPYEVICPNYDLFRNYNVDVIYNSIRSGKMATDPKVTEIRALKYEGGAISYKTDFNQNFSILKQRPNKNKLRKVQDYPQLFHNKLPISKTKYDHLQDIKSKINRNHWAFYDTLPFK